MIGPRPDRTEGERAALRYLRDRPRLPAWGVVRECLAFGLVLAVSLITLAAALVVWYAAVVD